MTENKKISNNKHILMFNIKGAKNLKSGVYFVEALFPSDGIAQVYYTVDKDNAQLIQQFTAFAGYKSVKAICEDDTGAMIFAKVSEAIKKDVIVDMCCPISGCCFNIPSFKGEVIRGWLPINKEEFDAWYQSEIK